MAGAARWEKLQFRPSDCEFVVESRIAAELASGSWLSVGQHGPALGGAFVVWFDGGGLATLGWQWPLKLVSAVSLIFWWFVLFFVFFFTDCSTLSNILFRTSLGCIVLGFGGCGLSLGVKG